jgi:hypothetical protein
LFNKDKTIYLMGGFGNVLFQINYAYNLRDQGFIVTLNTYLLEYNFITSKLLRWPYHSTLNILNNLDLLRSFVVESNFTWHLVGGLISKFFKIEFSNAMYFKHTTPNPNELRVDHLIGYFHENNPINEKLLLLADHSITNILNQPCFDHVGGILNEIGDSWVVHIRGGDYKSDSNFSLDIDYYINASVGKKYFYLVTNDREYANQITSQLSIKFSFVDTQDALEDFIILVKSNNKILANSTFSWWAAEMGSRNSNVIQPEPFFQHLEWRPMTTKKRNNF